MNFTACKALFNHFLILHLADHLLYPFLSHHPFPYHPCDPPFHHPCPPSSSGALYHLVAHLKGISGRIHRRWSILNGPHINGGIFMLAQILHKSVNCWERKEAHKNSHQLLISALSLSLRSLSHAHSLTLAITLSVSLSLQKGRAGWNPFLYHHS